MLYKEQEADERVGWIESDDMKIKMTGIIRGLFVVGSDCTHMLAAVVGQYAMKVNGFIDVKGGKPPILILTGPKAGFYIWSNIYIELEEYDLVKKQMYSFKVPST